MRKSSLMTIRRPPGTESTERNAPSVEVAFQAAPPEMVAEILDGELHLSPRPARPHTNVASNLARWTSSGSWRACGQRASWRKKERE
ncbi:MAG: hypothetical protein ACXU86_05635 [Archangium sp.]